MSKRKAQYRLYAMPVNEDNLTACVDERFMRITTDYMLVYKQGKKVPADAVEVTERELRRLTAADERWLFDCNLTLLGEEVAEKTPEIIRNLSDKMTALETALQEIQNESVVRDDG